MRETRRARFIRSLADEYPETKKALFDENGNLRQFINVFVNDENIKALQGNDTPVKSGDEIMLIPAIAGGAPTASVIGLYQANLKNEQSRGLSVRYRGIDDKGVASYLLSLYCSAAILSDDAIAVLEDVEVGEYYDYD